MMINGIVKAVPFSLRIPRKTDKTEGTNTIVIIFYFFEV